jgi:O-antigen ligase
MPEVIPGLLAVAVFVAWSVAEGGFDQRAANPGALMLLGLLLATAIAYRRRLRHLPRLTLLALALFAAFTLWSYVSITWADVKDIAWEGANRTLLYLVVFALFSITTWRSRSAAIVLGFFSVAIAGVGLATVLTTAGSATPEASFIGGRLLEPTGYQNGSAALYLIALWPALYLSCCRWAPWPVRGLMFASAGVLVQLALIPQSRGALIALPLALVVYLLLVPGRVRALLAVGAIAAVTAVSLDPLLDVYRNPPSGDDVATLESAIGAIGLSAILLLAVGSVVAILDRQIELSQRTSWLLSRAVGVAVMIAVVAGAVVFERELGDPVSWTEERWEDFKNGSGAQFESSRLGGSLGSNRYDYWQVAMSEFADRPLVGIGADNFAVPYLRERDSEEEPLNPHSLPVRVISQTGIVGATLFAGFLIAALWSFGIARRADPGSRAPGLTVAATMPFVYWFVHGSADWLWELPALTAFSLGGLAIAGRIKPGAEALLESRRGERQAGRRGNPAGGPLRWAAVALAAVAVAAAAVSYVLPWAAAVDVDAAAKSWGADSKAAFERLDRARGLNFLSAQPDIIAGTIAVRLDDDERVREAFTRALDREPNSWYSLMQLGALDALEGRRETALARLEEAARLTPRDPLVAVVLRRVRAGNPMPLDSINRQLLERACARFGPASGLEPCS